ncbi:MAG: CoxG family protein [Caulobacterales bacterium]
MQQSGEYRIDADIDAVWRALNDPDVLRQCIDGCQSVTKIADDAFTAAVNARIGPLSAAFTAEIKLVDLDPPRACTMQASVKGGAAGFGKGDAKVQLTKDGAATVLRYEAEGSVGGKLAQIGQRLIDPVVRKMSDDFFSKFGAIVAGPDGAAASAVAAASPTANSKAIWIVGAVALVAAAAIALLLLK